MLALRRGEPRLLPRLAADPARARRLAADDAGPAGCARISTGLSRTIGENRPHSPSSTMARCSTSTSATPSARYPCSRTRARSARPIAPASARQFWPSSTRLALDRAARPAELVPAHAAHVHERPRACAASSRRYAARGSPSTARSTSRRSSASRCRSSMRPGARSGDVGHVVDPAPRARRSRGLSPRNCGRRRRPSPREAAAFTFPRREPATRHRSLMR